MGRYYSGDIEGKFWFAVQDSDDASFFGGEESELTCLNYYFDKDNLKSIEKGIKQCLKKLGRQKDNLDKFFKKNDGYNDEMIAKAFGIDPVKVKPLLVWYARLELGEKILKCVKKKGYCSFDAEL